MSSSSSAKVGAWVCSRRQSRSYSSDGENDDGGFAATGYVLRVAGEGGVDEGAEAVLGVMERPSHA